MRRSSHKWAWTLMIETASSKRTDLDVRSRGVGEGPPLPTGPKSHYRLVRFRNRLTAAFLRRYRPATPVGIGPSVRLACPGRPAWPYVCAGPEEPSRRL